MASARPRIAAFYRRDPHARRMGGVHVSEIGMGSAADTEILERARAEHRVCVTLDADFHALLATSGETDPSVVRIRKEGLDATALAALLEALWPDLENALVAGWLP